jgi:hypothetical protein
MDNGTVPSDVQPPSDPVPVSPAVTSRAEPDTPLEAPEGANPSVAPVNGGQPGPNPAMAEAATFADLPSKLREGIAKTPLLSVGIAALAGLSAALLIRRPKPARRLKL